MEILTFEIADRLFAVRSSETREVLRAVALCPLAEASQQWEGVLNLRGRIVPVLDLRFLFHLPSRPIAPTDHLIVIETTDTTLAVRADRALDLARVDAGALEDAETIADEMVYVDQIIKTGDALAHLLAPERFPRLTGGVSA